MYRHDSQYLSQPYQDRRGNHYLWSLCEVKEQTQANVQDREGQKDERGEGVHVENSIAVFKFFIFILSEEAASSKSHTGFMSLPVVSNNGSILCPLSCSLCCEIQPLSSIVFDRGFLYFYSVSFTQWISHHQTYSTIMQQETRMLLENKLKVPLHRV